MQQGSTPPPARDGLSADYWPRGLTPGSPSAAGLDSEQVDRALAILTAAVEAGRIPGAVAVVARRGVVAAFRAMGWAQLSPHRREMDIDTVFDVASLTKVMATLPMILRLAEQGAFHLDDQVQRFFPEFTGDGKDEVRIRHLLTHTGGFAPWIPFENGQERREDHIRQVLNAPLRDTPGTRVVYTDLGFIILGELVERLTGWPLDRCVKHFFYDPLGLRDARFNPPPEMGKRCAATEYREQLGRHQCGEVHDERSTALGGVAGHAGLFATALEVAAYGQMWCSGGAVEGRQLLSPATVAAATRSYTPGPGESRGWGWIVARENSESLSCGELFSTGSFGHTGFTGTSLWVDPLRQLVVALLTNRVHLGREPEHIQRLRPQFHNAVAAAVQAM